MTRSEIEQSDPGWTIWTGVVPGGETAEEVAARADRVITRATSARGDALLFAHGHLLRVLAARWLGLPAAEGRLSWIRRPSGSSDTSVRRASSRGGTLRRHRQDERRRDRSQARARGAALTELRPP